MVSRAAAYAAAAELEVVRAGGTARLRETGGDHYTLIDPATPDWAVVVDALPGLLGGAPVSGP